MPEFLRDGDGKDRLDVRMVFRLTLPELTNVVANRVSVKGLWGPAGSEGFTGDEILTSSETMAIVREGLREHGESWTVPLEDTPPIYLLWAQEQLIRALIPSLRRK